MRLWAALAAAVLVGGALSVTAAVRAQADARLVRNLADDLPQDKALVRLASAEARPLFRSHCAGCHGDDLQGDPARGAPRLNDSVWLFGAGKVSDIEQTIRYGIRSGDHRGHDLADMPAFGTARPYRRYGLPTLSKTEISELSSYIRAIGGHGSAIDASAAAAGAKLYAGSAQCYDCHTSDARGDTYIGAPNLLDAEWLWGDGSQTAVEASIAGGRAGVCPAWAGRLTPRQIRALAVYIHSSGPRGAS